MPAAEYSRSARLLHRLALGSRALGTTAFDLERSLHGRNLPGSADARHVFVCGLARAGTTILMRNIHATGRYGSLTYRDMPFVMAPNLWARLNRTGKPDAVSRERAHGDGLDVSVDSPEALDEVFWRMQCGEHYILADRLRVIRHGEADIAAFRTYVDLVLKHRDRTRYLSKNNNNVLRIDTLNRAFPAAVVLVPFRDPVTQAGSLLRQHRRFRALQDEDPFVSDYMGWLVHHEFGGDHRPFDFGDGADRTADEDHVDYWLARWLSVYEHLFEQHQQGEIHCNFLAYEQFTRENHPVWADLARRLDLDAAALPAEPLRPGEPQPDDTADAALVNRAAELYQSLAAIPTT